MKLRDRLIKMMYGRYGLDDLYKFLFGLYIVLFFINLFLKSEIINYLCLLIVIIMFYRAFSKKIYQRSKENTCFLNIKKKAKKPFSNIKRNKEDMDHVYKKCHHCHKTLKLPLPFTKGIKYVVCPKCNKRNMFLILKQVKIEVIKKDQK